MFTGIVQSLARVFSINTQNNLSRLVIEVKKQFTHQLELGASIAINGVCLTVVEYHEVNDRHSHIAFDVIDETLKVTNLGTLTQSSEVNVERSLKVGDEIGGHQVSGHIHTLASLSNITQTPENTCLQFTLADNAQAFNKYLFDKGFIAINGTSLTLGKVEQGTFNVHIIPETLQRTNLSQLKLSDMVNIEFDQQTITIVNTIERMKLSL